MGLTFIACPPIKEWFPFLFRFSGTGKKFIPRFISVSKFLRVAENHSKSDKSRPSASILVLFPKFDTSRHLHISVCVLLTNVSSLKKNPWRKLRNYLTSTSTRAPLAPMCLRLLSWHPSRRGGGQLPPAPRPARHCSQLSKFSLALNF